MAQFDVHRNRGNNRDYIPFVLIVQSSLFDAYDRRAVMPLVRKLSLNKISNPRFNPTFIVEWVPVVLHPLEIVSVSTDKLGKRVESLAEDADVIVGALDELISRAWD